MIPVAMIPAANADPEPTLRQTRERFIAAFPARCASIQTLIDTIAAVGPGGPVEALRRLVRQLTDVAGTVGFPTVGERALDLDQLAVGVRPIGADAGAMTKALQQLRAAFAEDRSRPAPAWARQLDAPDDATVLVIEGDPVQRDAACGALNAAGYRASSSAGGADAFDVAQSERPSLIVLDVDLANQDAYAVCRRVKTSPDLAATPVMFIAVPANISDRLTGFALAADDHLAKPIDPRELLLRVQHLLRRVGRTSAEAHPRVLNFEAFRFAAEEMLQREGGALVLVRVLRPDDAAAIARLAEAMRRRDVVGRYDERHLLFWMASASAAAATGRFRDIAAGIASRGSESFTAGIAEHAGPTRHPGRVLEALLAEADEALTVARCIGEPAARKMDRPRGDAAPRRARVLLASNDPEIVRIVEAQMRAARHDTVVAGDRESTLAEAKTPTDLLVLDLMLPELAGFDVLRRLREPDLGVARTLVLSTREHEGEVTRAFELGADDYATKPFSAQELMARVAHLLR
jgi:DNA-binding response OmpR family regulator